MSIFRYIAKESSPRIATSYNESIREACEDLKSFPLRGTARSQSASGVRTMGFDHSVTIAFRVLDARVVIVGIFYRGRDVHNRL